MSEQIIAAAEVQKGPAVWLDLDQRELDDAYNQAKYASNRDQIVARYATNSALVRSRIGEPRRASYGPSSIETLDIYLSRRSRNQ